MTQAVGWKACPVPCDTTCPVPQSTECPLENPGGSPTVARMLWIDSPMPPADLEIAAHSLSVSKMPCSRVRAQGDAAVWGAFSLHCIDGSSAQQLSRAASMLLVSGNDLAQGSAAFQPHLDGVVLRADQEAGAELGAGRARVEERRAGVREPAGQEGAQSAARQPHTDADTNRCFPAGRRPPAVTTLPSAPLQRSAAATCGARAGAAPHRGTHADQHNTAA